MSDELSSASESRYITYIKMNFLNSTMLMPIFPSKIALSTRYLILEHSISRDFGRESITYTSLTTKTYAPPPPWNTLTPL